MRVSFFPSILSGSGMVVLSGLSITAILSSLFVSFRIRGLADSTEKKEYSAVQTTRINNREKSNPANLPKTVPKFPTQFKSKITPTTSSPKRVNKGNKITNNNKKINHHQSHLFSLSIMTTFGFWVFVLLP